MTREELVEAVEKASTAKNVAVAEVTAAHDVGIEAAEAALKAFDESAVTAEEVEAVVEGTPEAEVVEEVNVVNVDEGEEPVVEIEDDENSPTAEEEAVLSAAAAIEAKYQK